MNKSEKKKVLKILIKLSERLTPRYRQIILFILNECDDCGSLDAIYNKTIQHLKTTKSVITKARKAICALALKNTDIQAIIEINDKREDAKFKREMKQYYLEEAEYKRLHPRADRYRSVYLYAT